MTTKLSVPFACALSMITLPAFAEPLALTHSRGTLTLEGIPQKILTSDINALDDLQALGIAPAGVPYGYLNGHLAEFNDPSKYANIGTMFEPDVEAIVAAEPDLYIIGDRSTGSYDTLSKLVPTVDFSALGTQSTFETVRHDITLLGNIFDKEDRAEQLLEDLDAHLEAAKLASEGKGSALILVTNGGKLGAYGPNSRLGWIHTLLGFGPLEDNIDDRFHGGDVISFEYILEKNPDYVFVLDRDAAVGNDGAAAQAVLDNELFNQTKAAKEGHVIYLDPFSAYIAYAGYTSLVTLLEQIKEGLE